MGRIHAGNGHRKTSPPCCNAHMGQARNQTLPTLLGPPAALRSALRSTDPQPKHRLANGTWHTPQWQKAREQWSRHATLTAHTNCSFCIPLWLFRGSGTMTIPLA